MVHIEDCPPSCTCAESRLGESRPPPLFHCWDIAPLEEALAGTLFPSYHFFFSPVSFPGPQRGGLPACLHCHEHPRSHFHPRLAAYRRTYIHTYIHTITHAHIHNYGHTYLSQHRNLFFYLSSLAALTSQPASPPSSHPPPCAVASAQTSIAGIAPTPAAAEAAPPAALHPRCDSRH